MLIPHLRQGKPTTSWRVGQNTHQRGASRIAPKKGVTTFFATLLDYCKIASWLLLAVVLAIALYNVTNKVTVYINQPIAKVTILGDLGYINQQGLQNRIEPWVNKGFIDVDLEGLRQTLEKTPWISHVQVERVWPNELKIYLNARHPMARWGESSLLNNVGEPFITENIAAYHALPLLDGPDYAQSQVIQQYQIISQLLRPMDYSITSLILSDRGSWSLTTNTGLELVLGNGDLVGKVRRFSKAYQANLKDKIDNVARIDLRYSNGLAVAWKDPSKEIASNVAKMVARQ